MNDMDILFQNPKVLEILGKGTPFADNLYELVRSRFLEKNYELPFRYLKNGGQVLAVGRNHDFHTRHYRQYEVCGKGWNWEVMSGPSSLSEYHYGGDYFEYDPLFMYYVVAVYLSFLCGEVTGSYESLLSGTPQERSNLMDMVGITICGDAILEELKYEYEIPEDGRGVVEDRIAKLLILSCAYIDAYIHKEIFPEDWENELNILYEFMRKACVMGDIEESDVGDSEEDELDEYIEDGVEYLDYFLDCAESITSGNAASFPILIPLLLVLYFSLQCDEEGRTIQLFYYSSKGMAEYKSLKERYPDSPYVERIDKMMPFLEDPAGVKEEAYEGEYAFYDSEVVSIHSGYCGNEYICAYLYYDSDICNVSLAFPMAAAYFDSLLEEFKKEVEVYEKQNNGTGNTENVVMCA